MIENVREHTENREVIQRYCPRKGENVVMIRIIGTDRRPKCMNYDTCPVRTDGICGDLKKE